MIISRSQTWPARLTHSSDPWSHWTTLVSSHSPTRTPRRCAFTAPPESVFAEGTYSLVSGPTYETRTEGRFLRAAGAVVVGMSTVPEVLAVREEGVEVLVLSLVTNAVVIPDRYRSIKEEVRAEGRRIETPESEVASHEEVLAVGRQKAEVMKSLVACVIELIPSN
ncbi:nucleoside phosphorylase domain-containing protein [Sparassis latifolia]